MSAERYEIFDDGPQIRILYSGSISTIISGPLGTHIEDAVIGAIRQQARDLEQLRGKLAVAVAERDRLIAELPLSTGRDVNETRERLGPITRIADGPSERAYVCATTARDVVGYVIAERDSAKLRAEQAEARLAAIDNAPTVAVVCSSHSFGQFVQQRFFGSQLPRIGTELIARPAKD